MIKCPYCKKKFEPSKISRDNIRTYHGNFHLFSCPNCETYLGVVFQRQ